VQRLENYAFDAEDLRQQAARFGVERFRREMAAFLEQAASPD
jgi:hypothetical protein